MKTLAILLCAAALIAAACARADGKLGTPDYNEFVTPRGLICVSIMSGWYDVPALSCVK